MYDTGNAEETIPEKVFGRKGFEAPQMHESTNSDFEEAEKLKKGEKLTSTTSNYLFREINLFIPETIGVGIALLVGVLCAAFGWLFNSKEFLLIGVAVPIVVMVLFYLARFLLFMPNKHRHLTHRLLASGAIRTSIDDVRTGEVKFDKSPLSPKIRILNPRKHVDFNTGRPVIILREGAGENVSLNVLTNSQQAQEINSVIDSVWGLAEAYTRYNIKKAEGQLQMFLIILVVVAILAALVSAYFGYTNSQSLSDFAAHVSPILNQIVTQTIHTTSGAVTSVVTKA